MAATLAVAAVAPAAATLGPAMESLGAGSGTVASRHPAGAERALSQAASRSLTRPEPPPPHLSDVEDFAGSVVTRARDLQQRWLSADLNVWSGPGEGTRLLTVLDAGRRVRVTGTVRGDWAQILHGDDLAWVRKAYLVGHKPAATDIERRVSGAPCPDGSSVESGLTANAIGVYRAVCAAFPAVSAWGGRSGSGEHATGRALDIMATGSLGDAIADYVRANAGRLRVSEVIWSQHIWTVQRAGEGWRYMPDRGSPTANHYDHVHVSVY